MTGLTLVRQLTKAQRVDDLNGSRRFLPMDTLDMLITEDNVKSELERRSPRRSRISLTSAPDQARTLAARVVTKRARKLFVILLHLKKPWDVKRLIDLGINDDHLPLFRNGQGRNEDQLQSARNAKVIFNPPADWDDQDGCDFIDKQWLVLAPVFGTSGAHRTLEASCPLPLIKVDGKIHGPGSVVYKTDVHTSHQQDIALGSQNAEIALKEFKRDEDFQQERDNLRRIRKLRNKHITIHFETFSQGDRSYIVFPWAGGGDLEHFWKDGDKKTRTHPLALWSLEQMLGLSEAVHALHEEMGEDANCRHGDLKPQNILHFLTGSERGILKISDFGISRIHLQKTINRNMQPTITRATSPSYEAPEAVVGENRARSRKYDIWSLGCIFLEFTIWLVQDWEAINRSCDARKPRGHQHGGAWAHFYRIDGSNASVHPEVPRAIHRLQGLAPSAPGTALGDLLDIIQGNLVRVDIRERLDAKSLCEKLKQIISMARANPAYLFGPG
ncbi:kinase-like domain-containing protein [Colletotrichum godetiae]|uniref:Kinase-like domain-containing protein n=1 Tax=Colletotrichum godetiae TaxID=1209918 RepID=A0AAJ0EUL7_9PEZI|nr:kinase-like domain-containing protein [Colletotrichum godetiae]KAK1676342.1 kinase-like domain-containing protein [Colletotrichum godetiae]